MRTICVMLKETFNCNETIVKITNNFPCFVSIEYLEEDSYWIELTIKCREEDAGAIERLLSPFV